MTRVITRPHPVCPCGTITTRYNKKYCSPEHIRKYGPRRRVEKCIDCGGLRSHNSKARCFECRMAYQERTIPPPLTEQARERMRTAALARYARQRQQVQQGASKP